MNEVRRYLATLVALSILSTGIAQSFRLGPKVGYQTMTTSITERNSSLGVENIDSEGGSGFHVGLAFEYAAGEVSSFRMELLYSKRSITERFDYVFWDAHMSSHITGQSESKFSYLEIPLLLSYMPGEHFNFQLGPGVAFLLNADHHVTGTELRTENGNTTVHTMNHNVSTTEGLNQVEIGGILGVGYRFNDGLDLSIRYWRGLNSIEEDNDRSTTNVNLFQFSIAMFFSNL